LQTGGVKKFDKPRVHGRGAAQYFAFGLNGLSIGWHSFEQDSALLLGQPDAGFGSSGTHRTAMARQYE
jgi:hypothetical protein